MENQKILIVAEDCKVVVSDLIDLFEDRKVAERERIPVNTGVDVSDLIGLFEGGYVSHIKPIDIIAVELKLPSVARAYYDKTDIKADIADITHRDIEIIKVPIINRATALPAPFINYQSHISLAAEFAETQYANADFKVIDSFEFVQNPSTSLLKELLTRIIPYNLRDKSAKLRAQSILVMRLLFVWILICALSFREEPHNPARLTLVEMFSFLVLFLARYIWISRGFEMYSNLTFIEIFYRCIIRNVAHFEVMSNCLNLYLSMKGVANVVTWNISLYSLMLMDILDLLYICVSELVHP
jgi:hypothetical protein